MVNLLRLFFIFFLCFNLSYAQDEISTDDLFDDILDEDELFDEDDSSGDETSYEDMEEVDDYELLKKDVGFDDEDDFWDDDSDIQVSDDSQQELFEAGPEERRLLELAQSVSHKMSDEQWADITTASNATSYTVQEGDWLFKISRTLFGTGFYYPKIWALNPYIKNPHEIEPGMLLVFDPGSGDSPPDLLLAEANLSPEQRSEWFDKKEELRKSGAFVGFANQQDTESLKKYLQQVQNTEYRKYTPPSYELPTELPGEYDELGFDTGAIKEVKEFKEGYYLNTFITTNEIKDFGHVSAAIHEGLYIGKGHTLFLEFDQSQDVQMDGLYSLYVAKGKVSHSLSDRSGKEYTILGTVRIIGRVEDQWKAEIVSVEGLIERGVRITTYTPKIEKIYQNHNPRLIEAMVIKAYSKEVENFHSGEILYLDRGRADGVEIGNIFETYGFVDRATRRKIANQPAYKTAELVVISVSDNFSTALVLESKMNFQVGDIAVTLTPEKYAQNLKDKKRMLVGQGLNKKSLGKEQRVDSLQREMDEQIGKINLSEDERKRLDELDRELYLSQNLDEPQKKSDLDDADLDEFESVKGLEYKDLDSYERQIGRRYLDDSLDNKDNPFGLSEFDVEAVDELLNIEKARSEQNVNLRQSGTNK